MAKDFVEEERGSIPFIALGIVIVLTAAVGVYHFNKIDLDRVTQRMNMRVDMETFYALAQTAFDIQQKTRHAAEKTFLEDSIDSYAKPIDVDSWHENGTYKAWRESLVKKISKGVARGIAEYYGGYPRNGSHRSGSLEYDFTNFFGVNDSSFIGVGVLPDEPGRRMTLNISIYDDRHVRVKNLETGFSLGMSDSTLVAVDDKPFTMAKSVYEFTGIFKKKSPNIWDFDASRDTVDEFAWYIWAAEEALGLLEANLRHDVRYATDERVTYSLAHMIIAYKEKQHFGTYDYLHVIKEVLRPWLRDEDGGREFLGLLKRSLESGYTDQAIGMMEAGELMSRMDKFSWKVNNGVLSAIARLDSSLVSAANFPRDYIRGRIPNRGALQQLRTARDISSLKKAEDDLGDMRNGISAAGGDPGQYQSRWAASLSRHSDEIHREYREFTEEIDNAQSSVGTGVGDLGQVVESLGEMEHALNESKCKSMIASQLWYGSSGEVGSEGMRGLEDIIPVKVEEARDISNRFSHLQGSIGELRYHTDKGDIDEKYESASDEMRRAKNALDGASTYRGYYNSCRESWGTSHSSPTPGCEESRTEYEVYECGTDEEPATCTRSWREYRCICKDYYQREYADRMSRASYALSSATEEIGSLNSAMDDWFDDHGYEDILDEIADIHGYETGGGLMDFYYNHYRTRLPSEEGYSGAFEYALNISATKSSPRPALSYRVGVSAEEEFVDYGYAFVHATLTGLYSAFSQSETEIDYKKAGEVLKAMKKDGFFDFLVGLVTAISNLLNYFGDILNLLSSIDKDFASFPYLREHLYSAFPLPPIGQSEGGFSLLHDIRMRADNRPAAIELSLPLIGKRKIELPPGNSEKGGRGYSIPIPFTPLYIYAWGFDVARSQAGNEPFSEDAMGEKSILWLVDYENQGNLAPLAMVKLGNGSLPVPIYLHRPLMYKYEFTAGDYGGQINGISKGFKREKLPPVMVIALGPFTTNFRGWVEPPDVSGHYVAVDVAFNESEESITVVAKLISVDEKHGGSFLLRVYETGSNNAKDSLLAKEVKGPLSRMPLELVIRKSDLSRLKTHGWSQLNADLYALDQDAFSSDEELHEHVVGEDHASLSIVDNDLKVDVRFTDYDGESIGFMNEGNRRVEVGLVATGGCCFFNERGSWERGLWSGSLEAGETRRVKIKPVGPVSLKLEADIPLEVQSVIKNYDFHPTDYYELK